LIKDWISFEISWSRMGEEEWKDKKVCFAEFFGVENAMD
jgi:hypothetical protein